MPAGQISDFNAGVPLNAAYTYEYYEPVEQNAEITAILTGTFPSPAPPTPPIFKPIWSNQNPNSILLKLWGIIKGDECRMNGNPIYVYQDVSNQGFPMAYQFQLPDMFKWLSLSFGMFNLGGATGNDQVSIRVHSGRILEPNTWAFGTNIPPDPNPTPKYVQLAVAPVVIPWEGDLVGYLKFLSWNSSAPANSQLELMIQPFNH
jgi:hypothetical protein